MDHAGGAWRACIDGQLERYCRDGRDPMACVVNLAIRPGLGARFFDRLYAGLARSGQAAEHRYRGRQRHAARMQLAITITLIGEVADGALRRDAARAGDEIYVTGNVGDAAARMAYSHWRAQGARRGSAEISDESISATRRRGSRRASAWRGCRPRARRDRYQRRALAGPRAYPQAQRRRRGNRSRRDSAVAGLSKRSRRTISSSR